MLFHDLSFQSLILAHLLQLAHFSLRPSLANKLDPVEAHGLRLAVSSLDEDDEGSCLLKFDIAQANVGGTIGVPVVRSKLDGLSRVSGLSLVEIHIVWPVDVKMNHSWSSRNLIIVVTFG